MPEASDREKQPFWYKGHVVTYDGVPQIIEGGIGAFDAKDAMKLATATCTLWSVRRVCSLYIYALGTGGVIIGEALTFRHFNDKDAWSEDTEPGRPAVIDNVIPFTSGLKDAQKKLEHEYDPFGLNDTDFNDKARPTRRVIGGRLVSTKKEEIDKIYNEAKWLTELEVPMYNTVTLRVKTKETTK